MLPKDIVVFVEEEAGRINRFAFAAMLAEKWNAHLIATFVAERIELEPSNSFAVGPALEHMLQDYRGAQQSGGSGIPRMKLANH